MSKKLRFILATVVSLAFLVSIFVKSATAVESCRECGDKSADEAISCLSERMTCLQNNLAEAQQSAVTFKSTIAVLSGQINVLQAKVNLSLAEINRLEKEISELSDRIEGLNYSLDKLTGVLVERVGEQYKRSHKDSLAIFFSSESFSTLLSEYKYLKLAKQQTASAMERAEAQKITYDEQKALKEQKQQELEEQRLKIERQKADLNAKKAEQDRFLEQTKNSEKVFQQQLADAQRELQQIAAAAKVVIREGNGVAVTRGEVIGTMGNTGYSFGDHLHFGVYRYSVSSFTSTNSSSNWNWYYQNYLNPLEKLGSKSVTWSTGCGNDPSGGTNSGSGSWDWPMDNVYVTQNYGGNTCYNYLYGGKDHPALDLVGKGNISVKSVADGEAYFCRNCLGDGGNGVFVFHDDNYMSLYWHLK